MLQEVVRPTISVDNLLGRGAPGKERAMSTRKQDRGRFSSKRKMEAVVRLQLLLGQVSHRPTAKRQLLPALSVIGLLGPHTTNRIWTAAPRAPRTSGPQTGLNRRSQEGAKSAFGFATGRSFHGPAARIAARFSAIVRGEGATPSPPPSPVGASRRQGLPGLSPRAARPGRPRERTPGRTGPPGFGGHAESVSSSPGARRTRSSRARNR